MPLELETLQRTNRTMAMLHRINRAILRVELPDELYEAICRIAVKSSLFRCAWVALADVNSPRLRVLSSAGGIEHLHDELARHCVLPPATQGEQISVEAALPEAARQPCQLLQEQGVRAIASLPLRESGRVIGSFSLGAERADLFNAGIRSLLAETSEDLAFCLDRLLNEQRRLAVETRLDYLSHYDPQTGIPNQTLLERRLPELQTQGVPLVLFAIRLRRLDNIIKLFGGCALDEVMRSVALRLQAFRGADGLLVRLAQDSFGLLLPQRDACLSDSEPAPGQLTQLAQRMLDLLQQPVRVGEREVFPHAAIGAILHVPGGEPDTPAQLLRRAQAAVERSSLESRFCLYQAGYEQGLEQLVQMEAELHHALRRDEFVLHYEPQLEARSGRMVGVEALLRWRHPRLGMLPPSAFLPLLEESGLMPRVGAWVLREGCRQAVQWQREGLPPLRMAINLSASQFQASDLPEIVRDALQRTGLEPCWLDLELTESLILENAERTIGAMHALKALGVSLSLDDFGTGYSSLSYLRRYPVSRIKIDKSFVHDMGDHASSAALVRSILAMAANLGLKALAEGVETGSQFGYLRDQHCDEIQGYLFSRALPAEEIGRLIASGRRLTTSQAGA